MDDGPIRENEGRLPSPSLSYMRFKGQNKPTDFENQEGATLHDLLVGLMHGMDALFQELSAIRKELEKRR